MENQTRKCTYLGDGAYAEHEGYQCRIFTQRMDGSIHEVYLEYDVGFPALCRFVEKACGVKITIEKRAGVEVGNGDE